MEVDALTRDGEVRASVVEITGVLSLATDVTLGMPWIGSGQSGWRRVTEVARVLPVMKEQMTMHSAGHCEVAQMLARRLCLPDDYTTALRRCLRALGRQGAPGHAAGR